MALPSRPDIGRYPERKLSTKTGSDYEIPAILRCRAVSGNVDIISKLSDLVKNAWFAVVISRIHHSVLDNVYPRFTVRYLEFLIV